MRPFIALLIICLIRTNIDLPANAEGLSLPAMPQPGVMVHLSPAFSPAVLKGIVIHPENAFKFDFVIDKGERPQAELEKKQEYTKLIKYFMASLAVPDEDQWVNLSPYEKGRIIKDDFGKTEMGRDLLAQDYLLKQITASLIYPQDKLGQKFWNTVYSRAYQKFGTTNVPVNTFNKVWILPDRADIYEKGNVAYLYDSHLKVMLEEDYMSLQKHQAATAHSLGSQIVREIILPQLEKEVNQGKNFAPLRQVYSGMILAAWFKRSLRQSLLAQVYSNQDKLKGIEQNPKANELIYQQYLKAYKKGVFNFIQDETDRYTHEMIPRKYFSGGASHFAVKTDRDGRILRDHGLAVLDGLNIHHNPAMAVAGSVGTGRRFDLATADFRTENSRPAANSNPQDRAMTITTLQVLGSLAAVTSLITFGLVLRSNFSKLKNDFKISNLKLNLSPVSAFHGGSKFFLNRPDGMSQEDWIKMRSSLIFFLHSNGIGANMDLKANGVIITSPLPADRMQDLLDQIKVDFAMRAHDLQVDINKDYAEIALPSGTSRTRSEGIAQFLKDYWRALYGGNVALNLTAEGKIRLRIANNLTRVKTFVILADFMIIAGGILFDYLFFHQPELSTLHGQAFFDVMHRQTIYATLGFPAPMYLLLFTIFGWSMYDQAAYPSRNFMEKYLTFKNKLADIFSRGTPYLSDQMWNDISKEFNKDRNFYQFLKMDKEITDSFVKFIWGRATDQQKRGVLSKDKNQRTTFENHMLKVNQNKAMNSDLGGIDLNAKHLNLNVSRSGQGIHVPVNPQNINKIRIAGLWPEIVGIKSLANSAVLAQLLS